MEKRVIYYRFNLINLIYTLSVIAWGVFVRASGSGAGCGAHWPLCNGEIVPSSQKVQTFIEFTHRTSSGVSLILVLLAFLGSRWLAKKGSLIRRAGAITVIAIILEALLGAGLVLLRLVDLDQSALRAFSISLHSVNTLFLLGALTTLAYYSRIPSAYEKGSPEVFPRSAFFKLTLVCFAILNVAGAVTALGDTLFPARSLLQGMAQDFDQASHFLIRLRVIHPVFATVWVGIAFAWSKRLETLELKGIRALFLLCVTTQFCLGFLNWALRAPTAMQIVHLFVADLVFITLYISGLKHEARESRL